MLPYLMWLYHNKRKKKMRLSISFHKEIPALQQALLWILGIYRQIGCVPNLEELGAWRQETDT